MRAKYVLSYLLMIVVPSVGCGKTPLEARKELGQMGVKYTEGAFVESARNGDTLAIKLFLDAGMNPNARNDVGMTALIAAANNGRTEVVKTLLAKGVDVNAKGNRGSDRAAKPHGATALLYAADRGHADIVRLLLGKGADVNAIASWGYTALMMAAGWGRPEIVKLLLEQGADVNAKVDGVNYTALYLAAQAGNQDIIKMLLDKGADVNIKTSLGDSPLAVAERGRNPQIIALLKATAMESPKSFQENLRSAKRPTPIARSTHATVGTPKEVVLSTRTLDVPATEPWTSTGMEVKVGQILKITATGSVNGGAQGDPSWKWVGPDGWGYIPSYSTRRLHLFPEGKSFMALIGKIGEEGKPFYIGKAYEAHAKESGILLMGPNDVKRDEFGNPHESGDAWWLDNAGSFTVSIKLLGPTKTVPVIQKKDLSGMWKWECCGGAYHGEMKLQQKGLEITGTMIDLAEGSPEGKVKGKVAGNKIYFDRDTAWNGVTYHSSYEGVISDKDGKVVFSGTFFKESSKSVAGHFSAEREGE